MSDSYHHELLLESNSEKQLDTDEDPHLIMKKQNQFAVFSFRVQQKGITEKYRVMGNWHSLKLAWAKLKK